VLRYAGYCYDSESGLYYLSARHYDPATRQFLSKDLSRNDGEQSAYGYCLGNPVKFVDPTGFGAKELLQYVWKVIVTVAVHRNAPAFTPGYWPFRYDYTAGLGYPPPGLSWKNYRASVVSERIRALEHTAACRSRIQRGIEEGWIYGEDDKYAEAMYDTRSFDPSSGVAFMTSWRNAQKALPFGELGKPVNMSWSMAFDGAIDQESLGSFGYKPHHDKLGWHDVGNEVKVKNGVAREATWSVIEYVLLTGALEPVDIISTSIHQAADGHMELSRFVDGQAVSYRIPDGGSGGY
jgi:RHS repeat-associated protein